MPLLNRICWFLFILKKYYSHCFVILQIFIFFIFSFKIRSIRTKSNSIENDICEYIYRKHISKLQALNPIPPTTRRRSARQGVSEVLSLTGYGIVICCATKLGLCFCVDMLEGFSQFFFLLCISKGRNFKGKQPRPNSNWGFMAQTPAFVCHLAWVF